MANVLIEGRVHKVSQALLDARPDVQYEILDHATVEDIEARIAELDAIVLRVTPFRAGTIAKATRLKVVSRFGVGYDSVDVDALTARGIPLTIVGDANAVPVAEHALFLMLALARQGLFYDREIRAGNYGVREEAGQTELWGKTVLVVGFGRVGRRTALRCAAFDMRVIVADPYVAHQGVEAHGYRYVADFRDALAEADFVTLHLPGGPAQGAVMGTAEFTKMKAGAYFVNVARGTLVDEEALVDALTSGHLRGAGLDVMRQEPPALDSPLLELQNVVLSPHSAALTEECIRRMSEVSVQNILDALDGRLNPDFVVNKEVLGSVY